MMDTQLTPGAMTDMVALLGDLNTPHPDMIDLQEALRADKGNAAGESVAEESEKTPQLTSFADVEYEPPVFLIPPYVPEGKLTILAGDSSVGKTAMACSLAALVSTGGSLCGHSCQQRPVVMFSVEDDPAVLRGRIEADGGDLSQVYFYEDAATLSFVDPVVETLVQSVGAGLVIFDPLQAFLGGRVDMHRANETRPVLAQLSAMAKRNSCAVVIISHQGKGQQSNAMYKILGSVDIPAHARSVIQVGRNPDDPEERVMIHTKSSNNKAGESLAYVIGDRGGVTWKGHSPLTAADLDRAATRQQAGVDYDDEPIVTLLRKLMAENPDGLFISYADVMTCGQELLGFTPAKDSKDLAKKLGELRNEIGRKDHVLVETQQKSWAKPFMWDGKSRAPSIPGQPRGITLRRFVPSKAFQQTLPTS